jgi:hypothetical protein
MGYAGRAPVPHCYCYKALYAVAAFVLPGNSFVVWLWSVITKTIFHVFQLQCDCNLWLSIFYDSTGWNTGKKFSSFLLRCFTVHIRKYLHLISEMSFVKLLFRNLLGGRSKTGFCYYCNILFLDSSWNCFFHCLCVYKKLPSFSILFFFKVFVGFHSHVEKVGYISILLYPVEGLKTSRSCLFYAGVEYVVAMTYHSVLLRRGAFTNSII